MVERATPTEPSISLQSFHDCAGVLARVYIAAYIVAAPPRPLYLAEQVSPTPERTRPQRSSTRPGRCPPPLLLAVKFRVINPATVLSLYVSILAPPGTLARVLPESIIEVSGVSWSKLAATPLRFAMPPLSSRAIPSPILASRQPLTKPSPALLPISSVSPHGEPSRPNFLMASMPSLTCLTSWAGTLTPVKPFMKPLAANLPRTFPPEVLYRLAEGLTYVLLYPPADNLAETSQADNVRGEARRNSAPMFFPCKFHRVRPRMMPGPRSCPSTWHTSLMTPAGVKQFTYLAALMPMAPPSESHPYRRASQAFQSLADATSDTDTNFPTRTTVLIQSVSAWLTNTKTEISSGIAAMLAFELAPAANRGRTYLDDLAEALYPLRKPLPKSRHRCFWPLRISGCRRSLSLFTRSFTAFLTSLFRL